MKKLSYQFSSELKPSHLPDHLTWEVPSAEVREFKPKKTKYCFISIIWNEGDRIRRQLMRMAPKAHEADVILCDGRSNDGSTNEECLIQQGVRTILITDEKGLCTATRLGIAYAMEQGYEGIVTVDGNGKDGVEAISNFISCLENGYDLIQGSRFLKDGFQKNTPIERYLGVRFVMSPILSLGAGRKFTDVTNAFRACSMDYLLDKRVQPLRNEFVFSNLQLYLDYRAAKLKFRTKEIPVSRVYPDDGSVPTKITKFRTKLLNVYEMVCTALGIYNPD